MDDLFYNGCCLYFDIIRLYANEIFYLPLLPDVSIGTLKRGGLKRFMR